MDTTHTATKAEVYNTVFCFIKEFLKVLKIHNSDYKMSTQFQRVQFALSRDNVDKKIMHP